MEVKLKDAKVEKKGLGAGLYNIGADRSYLGNIYRSEVPMMENGKYITGLDKYSPTITSILDKEKRKEALKNALQLRERLEEQLGQSLDQDEPDGLMFWEKFIIDFDELGNLNERSPKELLLITVIKANAFAIDFPVAMTKESLDGDITAMKDYYVTDETKELAESVSKKVKMAECIKYVSAYYNDDITKLTNIASVVLPSTIAITKNTPKEYIFEKLYAHLDGSLYEGYSGINHNNILKDFLETVSLTPEELDLKVTISKSVRFNIIGINTKGNYYNKAVTGSNIGKTLAELYEYYRNPENQEEYGFNSKSDKPYSLKAQIKNKELI